MSKRQFKLLTKISFFFIFFIVLAFGISSLFLINKTNAYIESSVEHSIQHKTSRIIKKLTKGEEIKYDAEVYVKEISQAKDYKVKADIDTVMLDDDETELHLYRIREKLLSVNGKKYLITVRKNIDDFTKLKADFFEKLIPIFSILTVVLILFGVLLSHFLLRPFHHILNKVKKFRVGDDFDFNEIATSTKEFSLMQELYHNMVKRTKEDYFRLKEYTENMAHELQSPLTVIRNKTEFLIEDEELMKKHNKTVKVIFDETNHLSHLGQTLKLLTKIENKEFVNTKKIYSKTIIEDHIEKFEELAALKQISFNANLTEQHYFNMDSFLLEIVLKNLIQNAILYAPSVSEIKIETSQTRFSISNGSSNGVIVPEDPFKRFAKGNSGKSSLGLGLAIVHKICELNNLEINYQFVERRHNFCIK